MKETVYKTHFPEAKLAKAGKVRDMYDLGDSFLMVATDRISAFDVIMPDPIPDKGKILTQMSLFWFDVMKPLIPNHVITADVKDYPKLFFPYAEILDGRSIRVKKADAIPIECVVRGYLSGSGWKSYQESGEVCGIRLPAGLRESDKLPEPIFTPATKEEGGEHDINIDFETSAKMIGKELAEKIRAMSLSIYKKGSELAAEKGIIIADTKFEFGLLNNELIIIDEILTPDSSRFWPKVSYRPGTSQESFDKQYVRDYLISIKWDKSPPAPSFPEDVIRNTREKYLEALTQLTGINHAF